MIPFSPEQWQTIQRANEQFWSYFSESVIAPITSRIKTQRSHLIDQNNEPKAISVIRHSVGRIQNPLPDELAPYLKAVLMTVRRNLATELGDPRRTTNNPELLAVIDDELKPFDWLLEQDWCLKTEPLPIPNLIDFISIQQIEGITHNIEQFRDREYDEKFHILQTHNLYLPDLSFYRTKCVMRGLSLSTGFIDIDDFKSLNTKYGEDIIDRHVLPRFMQAIESHFYGRGFAYRYGGDEFTFVLPNVTRYLSVNILDALRNNLSQLTYNDIQEKTKVSIGLCHIDSLCALTEPEILNKATQAKKFAKEGGKNRIAAYNGSSFRKVDLQIVV
jgi:diguanylate cyclase (GGDEF)-like protein